MELRGPFLASLGPVRVAAALGALGLLAGCASAASSEVESDSAPTTVEGVVHVEQTTIADATTTSVSAKFLRVLPEDAVRAMSLVGSRVVTPHEGECAPIASLSTATTDLTRLARAQKKLKGQVELVDVGDLVLRASSRSVTPLEIRLMPRAFPDVGDLVSGVFYTQPDVGASAASELPTPGTYVLSGTGASVIEPFSMGVDAPATPANVRISGQPLGTSKAASNATAGQNLTMEWDAVDPDGLVYVDVQGATPYRCSFHDTGSVVVPGDVLSRDDVGHSVTLSVHRVREETVRLQLIAGDGQESTLVRFDFSRSGRLLVE